MRFRRVSPAERVRLAPQRVLAHTDSFLSGGAMPLVPSGEPGSKHLLNKLLVEPPDVAEPPELVRGHKRPGHSASPVPRLAPVLEGIVPRRFG
jgi:hypothetical protein